MSRKARLQINSIGKQVEELEELAKERGSTKSATLVLALEGYLREGLK